MPLDLYDLGEFLSTIQQTVSKNGEWNAHTAPVSLRDIRRWAVRLERQLKGEVAARTAEHAAEEVPDA